MEKAGLSIFLTEKRRLTGDLGVLNEKTPTEGIPVGENAVLGGGFGTVCRECRGSANRELGIISQEISADLPDSDQRDRSTGFSVSQFSSSDWSFLVFSCFLLNDKTNNQ